MLASEETRMSRLAELGIAKRLGLIVAAIAAQTNLLAPCRRERRAGVNQTRPAGAEVARTAEELRGLVGAFTI